MGKQWSHSAPVTLVCISAFGMFRKMPAFLIAIRDSYFIVCVYVYIRQLTEQFEVLWLVGWGYIRLRSHKGCPRFKHQTSRPLFHQH
jgi:hypothetical protein